MKKLFFVTTLLIAALVVFAAVFNPDAIVGVWSDGHGKGHVQIYKQSGKYYGKIIWLKTPKEPNCQPKMDRKNPNESLRNRPVMGLVVLRDFKYDDGEWSSGYIYNPSDGKEYKAYMKMNDDNTLSVRGYVGFSWIGKTDVWKRIK